jgi:Tfp pilus assembly protein PilV
MRGLALLEALAAMAVLMLGTLALGRLQAAALIQGSEAQMRTAAAHRADELLATAVVGRNAAACYTVPAAGACDNAAARSETDAWAVLTAHELRAPATVSATLDAASGQLTVSLGWGGRGADGTHELRMVTDVRR